MKRPQIFKILFLICILTASNIYAQYEPTKDIEKSQKEFAEDRFGIFIHWGIYSMFGQGEWYLNYGPTAEEYAKAAAGFYPANFNADEWVKAIKDGGAKYICITTRHHDGFSMFHTAQSDYNIVDATPFHRDILKELSEACAKYDIKLHLYYSHLDWTRDDYPQGRTGHTTGRDASKANWQHYYNFMNAQLKELLTNYGPIRAIWFDGWWDHDEDTTPFDWQLSEQYKMIHELQPGCMIGNNHHQNPFEGEDIQIFERDVPGENSAGYSEQDISKLPLETCNTMNGMWGYKVKDQDYKTVNEIIAYLVRTAGMGANLLLNIGPQPDGSLPTTALNRLAGVGAWLKEYGETIYGTEGCGMAAHEWGTITRKDNRVFVHILALTDKELFVPITEKVSKAFLYSEKKPIPFKSSKSGILLEIGERPDVADYVVELQLK
jgi:alpha-L-fucosidase